MTVSGGEEAVSDAARMARARLLRGWIATHPRWVDVDGSSMRPTIQPPARVLLGTARGPRLGEIWAVVGASGELVVHRYLGRRHDGRRWFWGDGLSRPDSPIAEELLVGRVIAVDDGNLNRADPTRRPVLGLLRALGRQARRRVLQAPRPGGCEVSSTPRAR